MLVAGLCSIGISFSTAGPAGAAPSAITGACTTAAGVTIIVDYDGVDGRYNHTDLLCAPDHPVTGLAALTEAGITYRGATRSPGFVCQIDGVPKDEPCFNESRASAHWSYWMAPRGSTQWCLSTVGAGGRTPPPGTVEGWSFSTATTSSTTRPPSVAPPPALPGVAPTAIPAGQCSYWRNPSTPTQPPATTPPPTVPPATGGSGSGGSTGGSGSGGSSSGSGQSGGVPPMATPDSSTKPGDGKTPGTNGPAGPNGSGADGKPSRPGAGAKDQKSNGTTEGNADADGSTADADDDPEASEVAAARVANERYEQELAATNARSPRRATDRPDEDDGSPVPLIFAAVAAIALLGIGVRASRRNRAAS